MRPVRLRTSCTKKRRRTEAHMNPNDKAELAFWVLVTGILIALAIAEKL